MMSPATTDPPMIRMVGVQKHFGSLHVPRELFAHKTIVENVELVPVRVRRIGKPEAHETAPENPG
jgi:ABC-type polar amino acid transport system ATPase subunit